MFVLCSFPLLSGILKHTIEKPDLNERIVRITITHR